MDEWNGTLEDLRTAVCAMIDVQELLREFDSGVDRAGSDAVADSNGSARIQRLYGLRNTTRIKEGELDEHTMHYLRLRSLRRHIRSSEFTP